MNSALLWNMGSGAYTAWPGPRPATFAPPRPVAVYRPCVQRTALGKPVEPDVKISRKTSSCSAGSQARLMSAAPSSPEYWSVCVANICSDCTRLGASASTFV